MSETIVIGRNSVGAIAEHSDYGVNGRYSFRYYLTPCCGADATGVGWGTGVACRACYAELPEQFGLLPAPVAEVFGDGITLDSWKAVQ